jgi:fructose-bisphosphate aldolase class I
MNAREIIDTAKTLVAGDKGLLAMDESNSTCNKRFAKLGFLRQRRLGAPIGS